MLQLSEHLKNHLPQGREFDAIMDMKGQVFREHKNRRTIRIELGGRGFFVKTHRPTSWGEIAKNAARGRWPVLTAEPEWRAIQRLERLSIPTIHAVGYGCRGRFPDQLESFIVTEELAGMIHLHELPAKLERVRPRTVFALRRQIVGTLARIARAFHANGLNHRDFYLCHFMIRDREWTTWVSGTDELDIRVIDLHRTQIRERTPNRWIIKDLSGLLFSALDVETTRCDELRFLMDYWGTGWRGRWPGTRSWRRRIARRALSLYRSEHGKSPARQDALASFA